MQYCQWMQRAKGCEPAPLGYNDESYRSSPNPAAN
jgi:hypothetical protein